MQRTKDTNERARRRAGWICWVHTTTTNSPLLMHLQGVHEPKYNSMTLPILSAFCLSTVWTQVCACPAFRVYNSKAKNAQEAHEAIRPTDPSRLPSSTQAELDEDQVGWSQPIALHGCMGLHGPEWLLISAQSFLSPPVANGLVLQFTKTSGPGMCLLHK